MDWNEILDIIWMILAIIVFILMIIYWIKNLKKSDKYWEQMNAQLELMKTALKKENDLHKAIIEFGDELMDYYYNKAKKDFYEKENDFNHGYLNATEEIVGSFLDKLEKHIGDWDGKESSD